MYDIEKIYQATSVEDAIKHLVADPDSLIIAGGSDILIKIHEGKLAGCSLVSIYGLDELRGVTLQEDGRIKIGPLTSFSHITKDPIIQSYIPVLGDAVDEVGGPQVRNIGTIGGNISNGVTSADSASTLFALNAELEITGPNGSKIIPIKDYYLGPGRVDLKNGELLTAIYIQKDNYENYYGCYIKYAMRDAMDIATLGCSVSCKLNHDKTHLEDVRLAYGVAGPVPMRCPETEEAVKGMAISETLFDVFGKTALTEVRPRDSWRASKILRLQLAEELCKRALKEAIRRAGGEC
ncbi:xanthine dehydrogenase FAD-binding subunit XdhB [Vallitalea pronyensis]|uniref:Xanthine dehydrogenase FAD-binding subunit XdhB n=1 Tax=Vallitalea pronyensis TaxID=1348613 RepID=A0A8J8ML21_9FIRM|nr:xanthine dehydrogenase subunit XdhB [Vallitalea pronyensis]QUI23476.1 xanthine dehydrogenase FAD-binding subunit XdhB [Vallitalea pronyensis]